jgi:hypothetical protein
MKLEQAFVDGAEFLDIKGGVIDSAWRRAATFLVIGEMPEGGKQVTVGQGTSIERLVGEQFAVERGDFEQRRQFLILQNVKEGAETEPEVGVIGPGGLDVEHARSRAMP